MKKTILFIFICVITAFASDHGIYLKVVANAGNEFDQVVEALEVELNNSDFTVLLKRQMAVPDLIDQEQKEQCAFRAAIFVLKNDAYTDFLTSFGNKYLVASFLKVGVYETENGVQVNATDPETINRIVFNDLKKETYQKVISGTKPYRENLINTIHKLPAGEKVERSMEPVRSDEDLMEASKDMFMMVGPMTFFKDEDQFPQIYEQKTDDPVMGVHQLLGKVQTNVAAFQATAEDKDYQWSPDKTDLNWQIVAQVFSADSSAVLLGLSRARTEALSLKIAGKPRVSESNKCPGIDHVCAYPIEVLIMADQGKVVMHTAREMFRMDMYFWDAGKMAFMQYMNMPKMLDESLKKALLGQ